LSHTDKAFTAYDIQACLYDERRVELFRRAIEETVRPGDIVVDAGSGTGLLGLLAAQAGAAKVFCLELNEEFIPVITENAARNGFGDRVFAIHADATTDPLPEMVDVVISEVISAGFFYEPQVQILTNLRKYMKPGARLIPLAVENRIELIHAQEKLYGLTFNYDSRFTTLPGDTALTNPVTYLDTDFREDADPDVKAEVTLRAESTAPANAVRITYRIQFTPTLESSEPTDFLLNPQIIFLEKPVDLVEGKNYKLSISYAASAAPLSSTISVERSFGTT
jgi:predicted RNA methylase